MAKNNGKIWLYGLVGVVLAAATIGGVMAANKVANPNKLLAIDYQGCMLDDLTGKKDEEDKTGISTKDFIEFENLKGIKVGKNDVTYYVNAYNKDKKFIQVDEYTADLTEEDLTAYVNLGVEYVKIEVVDPEDDEISFFDVAKVAKLVEVELGEAQEEEQEEEQEEDKTSDENEEEA